MRKLTSIIASVTMLLNTAVVPVAAAEFYITGNGSSSTSDINYTNTNTTVVTQDNQTSVKNKVNVTANTGENTAEDNTGGDVEIETGDSDVKVDIQNVLNSNVANVESCGSCLGDSMIVIDANGTESENSVDLDNATTTQLYQSNSADVDNKVDVEAETGDNTADDNTGGSVKIKTGDVDVQLYATTEANSNAAQVGSHSSNSGAGVEVILTGNGSLTANDANLSLVQSTLVTQDNDTAIGNDFDVDADTGENTADDNTGGEEMIETGDVDVWAEVWNQAGFNHFDAGDCCVEAVFAKIADNGTDTENLIEGELTNDSQAFQSNVCDEEYCFDNELELEGETGMNDTNDNTGDSDSDPSTTTGDVDIQAFVTNEGGSNVMGQADPVDGLSLGEGLNVQISFDLGALLAYLGL